MADLRPRRDEPRVVAEGPAIFFVLSACRRENPVNMSEGQITGWVAP